jgi:UDP-N-acetylmuramate dehydrogenase
MRFVSLKNEDCRFGYRDSVFKHEKGRYIVTSVVYRLKKNGQVNLEYRDVKEYFAAKMIGDPTLAQVRAAIVEIRHNKLPDWKVWGTAGSFFKNPIISAAQYAALKARYPELPGYPEPDGRIKVALGWIIDKLCDGKDLAVGGASVFDRQALVIVVKPSAKAAEVVALVEEIMKRVKDKTGIVIEAEVEWAVA